MISLRVTPNAGGSNGVRGKVKLQIKRPRTTRIEDATGEGTSESGSSAVSNSNNTSPDSSETSPAAKKFKPVGPAKEDGEEEEEEDYEGPIDRPSISALEESDGSEVEEDEEVPEEDEVTTSSSKSPLSRAGMIGEVL